jgi:flagellar basal-body rod protein FlgB
MDHAINPLTLDAVRTALDAATLRHAVHAHNLANVNTPGYQAMAVEYEAALGNVDGAAGVASEGQVVDSGTPVNLALEVAEMTGNSLRYQSLVRLLNRQLAIASIALNDGKR